MTGMMDWREKMQFVTAAKSGNSSYLDSDLARFDYSNKDILFKAIEIAACHGHYDIVSTLSKVVREYSAKSPGLKIDTSFPLHSAACMGHSDILRMLLNFESFPVLFELYSMDGLTVLHLAAYSGCASELLTQMLQRFPKMDVNGKSWREEFTALHMAADSGRIEVIRYLLQSLQPDFTEPWRVDPMAKDFMGRTALHYAAREGHEDVVQEFLNLKVEVGLQDGDYDGLTPLHMASRSGHVKVIRILMMSGLSTAAMNSRAKHSWKLKSYFDEEFLDLISYNGFHFPRPKLIDSLFWMTGGFTPLHFATRYGHLEAVRELLKLTESSINLVAAKDSAGFSPYDWAKLHNQEAMFLQIVEEQVKRDGSMLHHRLIVDRIVRDDDMPPSMKSLKLKVAMSDFIQENKDMEMLIHPWEIPHNFFHEPSEGCGVIPSNGKHFFLHMAAGGGDMVRLKWLLAHDIEINELDEEGFTALERALQGQQFKCAYELILHPEISLNQKIDKIVIQEVKTQPVHGLRKLILTEFMLAYLIHANIKNASRLQDLLRCAQENGMDEVARAIIERPELKRKIYEDRQVYLDCSNAILVGGALIAGLAYQGLLQPPLGYTYNYNDVNYVNAEENEGVRYFWWFNSFAFFLSVATVIAGATGAVPVVDEANILKSVEKVKRAMALASVLLGMAVVCVVGAYSAAGFGVLPPLRRSLNIIRPSVICGATACALIILWFCKRLWPLLLELLIRPITLHHLVQKVKEGLDSIDEPILNNLTQDFVDGTISYCIVFTKYFLLYILICVSHTLRFVGFPNGSRRILRYVNDHVGIIFNV